MQSDVPGGSDPGPIFKGGGGRIRIRFFFLEVRIRSILVRIYDFALGINLDTNIRWQLRTRCARMD